MLLAPLFLLGLLAIGLPLWLHRFSRQTRERQPFASLMLIEPSQIIRSRKHTLKYLTLLALRIGLLVAIVLAFTEPSFPWRPPPLEGRDRNLHVVVLDTSLSMQAGKRWEQALARARGVFEAMRPADQGVLVAADSRVRVVRGPVGADAKAELISALESIRPGFARLDYGMLMTSAPSWIGTERPPTQMHLITDLQRSASPLRFADLEPPRGVRLHLVDVGEAGGANLAITGLGVSRDDVNALEVRLAGSLPSGQGREVVLTIDGEEHARKRVPPGPAGEVRVVFPNVPLGPGQHRATAALEPADTLPFDDRFHAVLERTQPRALIVTAGVRGDDAAYFAAAVGALTSPRLEVERAGAGALSERTLSDYAVLVVSDVGILSNDAAGEVRRYLEGGGAVLMTLGPRAAALDSIPLSGHRRADGPLRLQRRSDQPGRVGAVEQSHPALRESEGWRSIRFLRYVPVEPSAEDSVLIRFEGGQPLLIERRVGSGRLLVLTSPLNRDWNDLAIHPLFVRFIGEAARYLTAAGRAHSAVVGSLLPMGGRAGAQVFDPRGERVLALGDTAGRPRLPADQPGFYEIRGGGRGDWIAVNADPRESDLTPLPVESLERWKQLETPAHPQGGTPVGATAAPAQLKSIWPWLLLIAVTLAFVEALVANSYLHVRRGVTS